MRGARKYENEQDWCDSYIFSDSLKSVSEIINHELQSSIVYAMIVKVKYTVLEGLLWFVGES